MIRLSALAVAITSTIFAAASVCASEVEFWIGRADRDGAILPFQIRLEEGGTPVGALDVPESYRLGLPLMQAERNGNRLRLGFGEMGIAHLIEGKQVGDRYEGTWHWTDENFACPFVLTRTADPRPYTSEEIRFTNGDVTLSGTVFAPRTPGPHAGIMMMPGSGDSRRWHWEGMRISLRAREWSRFYSTIAAAANRPAIGKRADMTSWLKTASRGFICCNSARTWIRSGSVFGASARRAGSCPRQRRSQRILLSF